MFINKIKKFFSRYQGFKQFLLKIILFFLVSLLLPILLFPFLEKSRYVGNTDPLPFFLVDIGSSAIFIAIAFILMTRFKLIKLKTYKYNKKQGGLFSFLTIISISLYLFLRYFTSHNIDFTSNNKIIFIFLIIFSIVITFFFLFLTIFNINFLKDFIKNFKKEILISGFLVLIYYLFTIKIKGLWLFLSSIISRIEAFLLNLSFNKVTLILSNNGQDPTLGVNDFIVKVGKDCSGIESIILYSSLFLIILFLDWDKLNKRKMSLLFIIGLLGTFLTNILRVYLIMLLGVVISPKFAIGLFHSNVGWILFILFFGLFWYFAYPWAKIKKRLI